MINLKIIQNRKYTTNKMNVLSPPANTQDSFLPVILNHLRFPSQRAVFAR